ncbi:MAG: Gfo/Idh/MocA family protein, partial [Thermoanaerobaculia bacterium]
MTTEAKLRFGVIGAGAFAEACHVPGLLSHPRAEVVAVVGRRPERARALAGRFGIPEVYADAGELCSRDDLDGIAICTPNAAHREQALLAFAHGKHVFCEKPLGLTVAEAEEMTRAA